MIKSKQLTRPQLVLIVDDQEINREVLGMILEDGYELIYACDGREAMEKIKAYVERYAITRMRGRNRRLIDGKHETPPEQIERLEKSA